MWKIKRGTIMAYRDNAHYVIFTGLVQTRVGVKYHRIIGPDGTDSLFSMTGVLACYTPVLDIL